MKVLVVGGGAREHIMAEVAVRDGAELFVALNNKNPGLLGLSSDSLFCTDMDPSVISTWAHEQNIDLALIGPESALASGIVDNLNALDIPAMGPTKSASRIEVDKEFMRDLSSQFSFPGQLDYKVCSTVEEARNFLETFGKDCAIKPIGLTGGKGVKVMGDQLHSIDEAVAFCEEIIDTQMSGYAKVVLEERAIGEEFTLQAFISGETVVPMPAAQDHPHALEGDIGAITGGMGSYSQADGLLPFLSQSEYDSALDTIRATAAAMNSINSPYRGILYGQFILTSDGPRLVEYNARFGDPEAMNVLSVLNSNFLEVSMDIALGNLKSVDFESKATVCKYIVPEGYGTSPRSDCSLNVDSELLSSSGAKVYYAAVNLEDNNQISTTTSRSAAVVGKGDSIESAEKVAEAGLEAVSGTGLYVRHDIATEASISKRVSHMKNLRS